jgi:hypothetical protein
VTALGGLAPLLLFAAGAGAPGGADDAPRLAVASDSECPSSAAVGAALAGLLGAEERAVTGAAAVHVEAGALVIRFRDPEAAAGERRVAVGADCGARAATAALLIATWIRSLPAEAPGSPLLAARPRAGAAPPAPPAASPAPAIASATPPPPAPRAAGSTTELGAGLMVDGGGGAVPGLGVELRRPLVVDRAGWSASAALPAARSVAVGAGIARWTRLSIALGPSLRWGGGLLFVDTDAALVGGVLFAWGQGYDIDRQGASLTVGVGGGARAGVRLGARLTAWVDARATRWLRDQQVSNDIYPQGSAAAVRLPGWDAELALGVGTLL